MAYTPKIISRADAGLPPPARPLQRLDWPSQRALMVLHWPGDPDDSDFPEALGDRSAPRLNRRAFKVIQAWWRYHVHTRGWSDIGYSLVVLRSGAIVVCRGWDKVPAAHASKNPRIAAAKAGSGPFAGLGADDTLALMRSANYRHGLAVNVACGNRQRTTRRQRRTLRWIGAHLADMAPEAPRVVLGHGELAATTCPGPEIAALASTGALLDPLELALGGSVPAPAGPPPDAPQAASGIDLSGVPVGVLCNNPGNLRPAGAYKWQHAARMAEARDTPRGPFAVFATRPDGMAAMLANLRYYMAVWNLRDIASITAKWAPADDGNDPHGYAQTVSRLTGVPADGPLTADRATLSGLAAAMAAVELGHEHAQAHYTADRFREVADARGIGDDPPAAAGPRPPQPPGPDDDAQADLKAALADLKAALDGVEAWLG